jgi:hypothetical protein
MLREQNSSSKKYQTIQLCIFVVMQNIHPLKYGDESVSVETSSFLPSGEGNLFLRTSDSSALVILILPIPRCPPHALPSGARCRDLIRAK